jgi:hypothetical protein
MAHPKGTDLIQKEATAIEEARFPLIVVVLEDSLVPNHLVQAFCMCML